MNTVPKTDRESDEKRARYKQFCKATYFRVLPLFPVVCIALESPWSFLSYYTFHSNSTVQSATRRFSQLNGEDWSRIEGKRNDIWLISNEPNIARHRIIINSNYYSVIYCSKYWFHSPHFSLKFCARHSCTSVLQKCAKTSIVCVSCIILPAVSCLRDTGLRRGQLSTAGSSFPRAHWPTDGRQLTGGVQCRRMCGSPASPAEGGAGCCARTVGAAWCSPIIR